MSLRGLIELAPEDVQVLIDLTIEVLGREWDKKSIWLPKVFDDDVSTPDSIRMEVGVRLTWYIDEGWDLEGERREGFSIFLWGKQQVKGWDWASHTWRGLFTGDAHHILEEKKTEDYLRFLTSRTRGRWCSRCSEVVGGMHNHDPEDPRPT